MPEGPWGPPAVPRDPRLGLIAHGVDLLTRATPASVRVPVSSIRCLGKSGPGPSAHGVQQVSWATRARAQGSRVSTSCPGRPGRVRGPVVSTGCPRRFRPVPEGQQGSPGVPGDSGPCLRAQDVDQMFQALGPGSEGPWVPPTVPCDLGPGPKARIFKQLSRVTRAWVQWPACSTSSPRRLKLVSEGPRVRPALPGQSRSGPMARVVDQLSRATPARL